MKHINRWSFIIVILAGLLLSACGPKSDTYKFISPAETVKIEGSDLSKVILTAKAAERLDVQTVTVSGSEVPYAAVIYDTTGHTWVYTNPEPLTYVRAPIMIDRIEGNTAFLSEGLAPNTVVVTVGVAEIYGTETGVSK